MARYLWDSKSLRHPRPIGKTIIVFIGHAWFTGFRTQVNGVHIFAMECRIHDGGRERVGDRVSGNAVDTGCCVNLLDAVKVAQILSGDLTYRKNKNRFRMNHSLQQSSSLTAWRYYGRPDHPRCSCFEPVRSASALKSVNEGMKPQNLGPRDERNLQFR